MTDLLLLGQDPKCADELASIFQNAGYEVIKVNDVASCCRQLQSRLRQTQFLPIPLRDAVPLHGQQKNITIFNTSPVASSLDTNSRHQPMREHIVSLARHLTPGWRLSMRHRRLEAPSGDIIELTSLEFSFIKIFTMMEVGETVSRKQVVLAFGEDYLSYDQNRIDTMVRRLRQKIKRRIGIRLPLNTERVRGFSFGDVLIIDQ